MLEKDRRVKEQRMKDKSTKSCSESIDVRSCEAQLRAVGTGRFIAALHSKLRCVVGQVEISGRVHRIVTASKYGKLEEVVGLVNICREALGPE